MINADEFKKLNDVASKIIMSNKNIRDTDKYKNMKSIFLDKTMSCSKSEVITSLFYV